MLYPVSSFFFHSLPLLRSSHPALPQRFSVSVWYLRHSLFPLCPLRLPECFQMSSLSCSNVSVFWQAVSENKSLSPSVPFLCSHMFFLSGQFCLGIHGQRIFALPPTRILFCHAFSKSFLWSQTVEFYIYLSNYMNLLDLFKPT